MSNQKEILIAGATILGASLACIAVGYSIGKDTNDGLLNYLREKNQAAEKMESQLRAEVSSLKLELQSSKSMGRPALASPSSPTAAASSGSGTPSSKPSARAETERVQIQTQTSASLFDGKVILSLTGISFEGEPLRNKVLATIGTPGKENRDLDKVDVGFAVVYEDYEVRVIASDTFSATFLVTRVAGKT